MIPYVQLEAEEAMEAKKLILSSQVNLLNIVKKVSSYKKFRKQEMIKKTNLKRELRANILKMNALLASLPESEARGIKTPKEQTFQTKKSDNIEDQIVEIRKKLESLS